MSELGRELAREGGTSAMIDRANEVGRRALQRILDRDGCLAVNVVWLDEFGAPTSYSDEFGRGSACEVVRLWPNLIGWCGSGGHRIHVERVERIWEYRDRWVLALERQGIRLVVGPASLVDIARGNVERGDPNDPELVRFIAAYRGERRRRELSARPLARRFRAAWYGRGLLAEGFQLVGALVLDTETHRLALCALPTLPYGAKEAEEREVASSQALGRTGEELFDYFRERRDCSAPFVVEAASPEEAARRLVHEHLRAPSDRARDLWLNSTYETVDAAVDAANRINAVSLNADGVECLARLRAEHDELHPPGTPGCWWPRSARG